jgi:molybdenum cofactor cytidylyltransferase
MADFAAIILAAGQAARYRAGGGMEASKLVADLHGVPLVRHVALAALASRARPVVAVTGHARGVVEAALAGLTVQKTHNPDFATGMASSLKTGIAALPPGASGAVVLLADMPQVTASVIDKLIDALAANPNAVAAVPVFEGKRGNPVVLARALFPRLVLLSRDEGARKLLQGCEVIEVAVPDSSVALDIDTPDALAALRGG